jgi:hypothetical protein
LLAEEEGLLIMKKNYLLSLQNAICFLIISMFSGCAIIQSDWENATRLNTLEAYEEFLKKHPYSDRKYQEKAKSKIDKLRCGNANRIVVRYIYITRIRGFLKSRFWTLMF